MRDEEDNKIKTTQTYYSILDCDMSDFACEFYKIVYGEFF